MPDGLGPGQDLRLGPRPRVRESGALRRSTLSPRLLGGDSLGQDEPFVGGSGAVRNTGRWSHVRRVALFIAGRERKEGGAPVSGGSAPGTFALELQGVVNLTGRDPLKTLDENLDLYAEVFP